jgi:zinc finger-like protein
VRCNACVSLADDDHHCIPQRLQGSCPICHESMFESTKPLRGLKCGHVMHLSCFTMYRRGGAYTCPLCKKSVEDMIEYFSMLDAAVRMQPMPAAYHSTVSNIYCQDCDQNGQVQYHFVGLKCLHCGSYNTRELGRVQDYSSQPANHSSGQTTR